MSSDDPRDESAHSSSDKRSGQEPLDAAQVDAAWQAIVANYGDRAPLDGPDGRLDPSEPDRRDDEGSAAADAPPATSSPFDRSYLDAQDSRQQGEAGEQGREGGDDGTRRWDDGEHFVPPPAPPVPTPTPLRRLAWGALCVPPLLMLAAVVLGWTFPAWLSLLLVGGFIGGFLALVATMPRNDGDGWDNGAVV